MSMSGIATPDRRSIRPANDELGKEWAEEADDAWDPCILALDGGGIRGYSSLLILRDLMHEIYEWEHKLDALDPLGEHIPPEEELLPCHYFDFMYGTSTGGLIATMLSRLRMKIDECLETYRKVGDDLFGHRRSRIPLATKYHHKPLEKAVQAIVSDRCYDHEHKPCNGKQDVHPWPHDMLPPQRIEQDDVDPSLEQYPRLPRRWDPENPRVSHSCCLTAAHTKSVTRAYLLRSYPHHYVDTTPPFARMYNEGADALKIWEVTRATSAAPFYFEVLEAMVEGEKRVFKDGGIRENNPSRAAWNEFHSLYEGRRANPALLLSVGTGRADQSQDGFAATWPGPFRQVPLFRRLVEKFSILPNLLVKFTESELVHEVLRGYTGGEHTWYKRLNVSSGLENMPLDHWVKGPHKASSVGGDEAKVVPGGATLTKMEVETEKYLAREFDQELDDYAAPKVMLSQVAEKLVRQRRARAREGGVRWKTFIARNDEIGSNNDGYNH